MDLNKIINGYKRILLSFTAFLGLVCLCVIAGFLSVYPLWKLAVLHKGIYTIFCLSVFFFLILFWLIKASVKAYKANPRRLFFSITKKLVLLLGTAGFIFFVLSYQRLLAFLILFFMFLLYGFIAFGISDKTTGSE